jgi:hypothetical protein
MFDAFGEFEQLGALFYLDTLVGVNVFGNGVAVVFQIGMRYIPTFSLCFMSVFTTLPSKNNFQVLRLWGLSSVPRIAR